jgi:two-component system response regulator QseB
MVRSTSLCRPDLRRIFERRPCHDASVAEPSGSAILLVEDDRALSSLLTTLLTEAGHRVDLAPDGQAGLHKGLTGRYDVLVLDRGLPVLDGVELLRRLRARGVATPALVLTARGSLADRVEGLDAGAEDYLVKPFEVEELLARVRALTRRHIDHAETLSLGSRRLNPATRVVSGGSGPDVELSGRECELLRVLAARPGQVFSRADLLQRVFDAAESPGAVDTYVHYLRRKLGKDVIRTVHGLGYRLGGR